MSAPLFATVISLKHTGHVLAAVAAGGAKPTIEQLTGKDDGADEPGHLRVRIPGATGFVNVPIDQLEATRLPVADDVLERPQSFFLGQGVQPLQEGTAPQYSTGTVSAGTAGKKVVVVWQTPDESIVVEGILDGSGNPPSTQPTGATHQLVAYVDGPLHVLEL
jgi:hypothetical protein